MGTGIEQRRKSGWRGGNFSKDRLNYSGESEVSVERETRGRLVLKIPQPLGPQKSPFVLTLYPPCLEGTYSFIRAFLKPQCKAELT